MSLWKEALPTLAAIGVASLRHVAPSDSAWRPSLAVIVAVVTVQAFSLLVAVATRSPELPPCCVHAPEDKVEVAVDATATATLQARSLPRV